MTARYLSELLKELAFGSGKMAFVSGPRQVGKTTMAKQFLKERGAGAYGNWDETEFRRQWVKHPRELIPKPAGKVKPLLVLDEIHKAKLWKRTLKGMFDGADGASDILVTGSARLNVYKKGSDSLLGRYYHFRLHPFSLREMIRKSPMSPDRLFQALRERELEPRKDWDQAFTDLMHYGGFPDPLFAQDEKKARLWRKGRMEKVIREDLRDISRIPELSRIEMLAALLPEKVGSLFSIASLTDFLEVSHETVKRWVLYMHELHYLFEVKPFQGSLPRSLKKEGKVYLWDSAEVSEKAPRFENLVACHLLKACDYWTDAGEGAFQLQYLRNKEKQEIDFLITRDGKPWLAMEAKLGEGDISPNWKRFLPHLGEVMPVQITAAPGHWEWIETGGRKVLLASAQEFLAYLV